MTEQRLGLSLIYRYGCGKKVGHCESLIFITSTYTVMSPNMARPLTLRTSPSDYVTFQQIKYFLIFNIRLLLEREKQQNIFTLCFHG